MNANEAKGNYGQSIPIPGVGMSLNYSSDAVRDRVEDYGIDYKLFDITPTFLSSIDVKIEIVDREISFSQSTSNDTIHWVWDGKDDSNQDVDGTQIATVTVTLDPDNEIMAEFPLGNADRKRLEMGDWSVSRNHIYSAAAEKLHLGNGTTIEAPSLSLSALKGPAVAAVVSESGKEIYTFDSTGRHQETVNALTGAVKETFRYDSNGRLIEMEDANNQVTQFHRDGSGQVTSIESPKGLVTTLGLSSGKLTSVTTPGSKTYSMTYGSSGMLASFQKPGGQTVSVGVDSKGNLEKDEHSGGFFYEYVSRISDDKLEITKTSVMGREETIKSHFDDESYSYEQTNFAGVTTLMEQLFTPTRQISTETADIGRTVVFQDDPRFGSASKVLDTVTEVSGTLTRVSSYTHGVELANPLDPFSIVKLWTQENTNGRVASKVYRGATKTWYETSPQGRTASIEIDAQERPVCLRSGARESLRFVYNSDGKIWKTLQGDRVTEYSYDSNGFLSSVKNALNQTTSYGYDSDGNLISETLPDARVIAYSYDGNGKLAGVTPPGKPAHGFFYNAMELLAEYLPPLLGGTPKPTEYVYNNDRELIRVDRPDGTQISYNRNLTTALLDSVSVSSTTLYSYGYEPTKGYLSSAAGGYGLSNSLTYNGRLLKTDTLTETSTSDQISKVTWAYDNNFWVTGTSIQGGSATSSVSTTFTRDGDGLITSTGDASYRYGVLEPVLEQITMGSLKEGFAYNQLGELKEKEAKYGVTSIVSLSYERDALGRVTEKTEDQGGVSHVYEYIYDSSGRLTEVKKDGVSDSLYTYDDNGNRVGGNVHGLSTTATYDNQDRILTYNGLSFTHNHNGERTSKTVVLTSATTSYGFSPMGQLESVVLPSSDVITYQYDGLGRRISRKLNGTLTQGFVYGSDIQIIADLDPSTGGVRSKYVYVSSQSSPDYMVRGGSAYKFIKDHLGSVLIVQKVSDGSIAQALSYDEFGSVLSDTNPGFQPFGFAGGIYDPDTNLVRFGARDYDAETGRWTTKDPILFGGNDTNLYGYVMSDPINFVDPKGLWSFQAGGGLSFFGGAFGGAFESGIAVSYSEECGLQAGGYQSVQGRGGMGIQAGLGLNFTLTPDARALSDLGGIQPGIGFESPLRLGSGSGGVSDIGGRIAPSYSVGFGPSVGLAGFGSVGLTVPSQPLQITPGNGKCGCK
ncbi:MAG TPA: RHS repeat-associated core domain-containing protein [Pseudobdellovibrionaceae bacterium]|nr:RHS repeat-associated core domain-containing protein [Pseudobdellovibrionaceae bacterium]